MKIDDLVWLPRQFGACFVHRVQLIFDVSDFFWQRIDTSILLPRSEYNFVYRGKNNTKNGDYLNPRWRQKRCLGFTLHIVFLLNLLGCSYSVINSNNQLIWQFKLLKCTSTAQQKISFVLVLRMFKWLFKIHIPFSIIKIIRKRDLMYPNRPQNPPKLGLNTLKGINIKNFIRPTVYRLEFEAYHNI